MKFNKIPFTGRVVDTLRTADNREFVTSVVKKLTFTLAGIPGDRHAGFHKNSGVRETELYKKGFPIKNHRQWSAVSVEEMEHVAKKMQIEKVSAEHLGANILIEGIPFFTQLPPLSRLRIGEGSYQVTLVVYEENFPCKHPQEAMLSRGIEIKGTGFQKAAVGLRGLVGWVENGGKIQPGDLVEVYIPQQWPESITNRWFK